MSSSVTCELQLRLVISGDSSLPVPAVVGMATIGGMPGVIRSDPPVVRS